MSPEPTDRDPAFLHAIGASFMSPQELRVECLRIAHDDHQPPGDVVDRARAYLTFALDETSPSEK
jgi:hypothetical protein